jgi:hypothetical protein
MDTKEKIKIVEELISHYKKLDDNFSSIYTLFGNADSKFCNSVWRAFDSYLELVSKVIGDEFGNLGWFIYENKCGKGGLICKCDGEEVNINSVENLIGWIELLNKREG